ncbi:MAG: hypothetical protein ACJA08_002502 [Cyclobacteriaceae bacterium]|jgi:hypothetical protein
MQEVLVPIAVIGTLALGIVTFTKILTEYFIRKKLVDKGLVGDDVTHILKKQNENAAKYGSLKWGLIVLFGGVGLIIAELMGYNWETSAIPYGVVAVSISLGFLTYYFMVKDKID